MKSRMDRIFSRIENLWPRDGSCPLPLRSKPFLGNCFRIVKAQKISRGCAAHVCGSPFAPNAVPAPVLQRRWLESRYHVRTAHEIFKVRICVCKRSAAMKAPVGLLSGSAVCDSRWRGVAPTSATPTRSHRKCRRIEEVKSRWNTTFSRIENLWPRDGSCPLPLRSKPFPGNCFRIVKGQKISSGSLLM